MINKIKKMKGFTLVELLIVIALIAILSVAVLATINPIEQSNKAKDSTIQNDAAEVLNAYERYYASKSSYPWADVYEGQGKLTNDAEVYLDSTVVGAGLCGKSTDIDSAKNKCNLDYTKYRGLLMENFELKDSFLAKGYVGNKVTEPSYENRLYLVKQPVAEGNSIFVCYVPKAQANRGIDSKLYDLKVDVDSGFPTDMVAVETDTENAYFDTNKKILTSWSFTDAQTSLFKCVP